MKNTSAAAAQKGVLTAIILIFLQLINMTAALGAMLEKMITSARSVKSVSPLFYGVIVALVAFFIAFSFIRSLYRPGKPKPTPLYCLGESLVIGLVSGVLIAALNALISTLNANGVKIRTYLDMMAPDAIKTAAFGREIPAMIGIYLALTVAGALLGGLIAWILNSTGQPANAWTALRRAIAENQTIRFIRGNKIVRILIIVAILIFVFALPFILSPYGISILGLVLIYAVLGLGLNLIVGLSGQLVFGFVAFYAIGAYTFALLTAPKPLGLEFSFPIAFLVALAISGLSGVIVGLPIMNLRGDYLAIVTLGFAEIIRSLVNSNLLADFTGGPQGIKDIGQPQQPGFVESLIGKPMPGNIYFLYVIMIFFAVTLYIVYRLQYSRVGRSWEAMREDETVAQACGVATSYYKVLAVIIGAVIAGAAGALYASRNTYIGPGDFVFMVSVNSLAVIVVGGMGSIPGALIGAFIIKGVPELLRDLEHYRMVVFGVLLIAMMIIRPEGLLPIRRKKIYAEPDKDLETLKKELRP